jgi:hypothetical protein
MCTLQRIDSTRDDTCLLPAIMSQPVDSIESMVGDRTMGIGRIIQARCLGVVFREVKRSWSTLPGIPKGNTMDDLHHSQNK